MATQRICSIDGCDKTVKARGWCGKHYHRWARHGDPLGGITAKGDPLRFANSIDAATCGDDCIQWPYATLPNGYGHLWVDGVDTVASRYVCERAHGPAPTLEHEAAHSCGKGHEGCINPNHLGWKTRSENQADKLTHGTHNRGENCPTVKLTESQVKEILALKGKMLGREVGEKYGVTRWTIFSIWSGKIWGWLSE